MGWLMSDTLLIAPMLDDTLRLRDGLSKWAYAMDAARDCYEHDATDPAECNGPV
jgi:hypothetical protein